MKSIIEYKGKKWKIGKWRKIKTDIVKNKNHALFDFREAGENCVDYFTMNKCKIPLNQVFTRYGLLMGFDPKCLEYPGIINCWTDYFSIFSPVYLELDEYGEKIREVKQL